MSSREVRKGVPPFFVGTMAGGQQDAARKEKAW